MEKNDLKKIERKSFKKLPLIVEKLKENIEKFFCLQFSEQINVIEEVKGKTQKKITILMDESEEISFDIFFSKEGVTLDFTRYGTTLEKIYEYLIPMKDWLLEVCSYECSKNFFVIKKLETSVFETILSLLSEEKKLEVVTENNQEKNVEKLVKILSKIDNSKITMTYFNTGTLLVQGIARHSYWCIFILLVKLEIVTVDEEEKIVLEALYDPLGHQNKKEEISDRFCIKELEEDCQKMLKTYERLKILLKNTKLEDYSVLCFNPLRTAEAVLRKVLYENENIILPQGYIFEEKKFGLRSSENEEKFPIFDVNKKIIGLIEVKDSCLKESIEELYAYYYAQRHTTFHGENYSLTRIIATFREAEEISEETIRLIFNLIKN